MGSLYRYTFEANGTRSNNNVYPWVVLDTGESGNDRTAVAYTETLYTAQQYVQQLNDEGYISAV